MKRDANYRHNLNYLMGSNVTLDCDDFMLTKRDSKGRQFLLLNSPKIAKAKRGKYNRSIDHLWCEVDGPNAKYLELAKSIRIMGKVYKYNKKDGMAQVGVKIHTVNILKYSKDIADEFRLSGGEQLSENVMNELLEN